MTGKMNMTSGLILMMLWWFQSLGMMFLLASTIHIACIRDVKSFCLLIGWSIHTKVKSSSQSKPGSSAWQKVARHQSQLLKQAWLVISAKKLNKKLLSPLQDAAGETATSVRDNKWQSSRRQVKGFPPAKLAPPLQQVSHPFLLFWVFLFSSIKL